LHYPTEQGGRRGRYLSKHTSFSPLSARDKDRNAYEEKRHDQEREPSVCLLGLFCTHDNGQQRASHSPPIRGVSRARCGSLLLRFFCRFEMSCSYMYPILHAGFTPLWRWMVIQIFAFWCTCMVGIDFCAHENKNAWFPLLPCSNNHG
jgi:hypothetical protein